jgi:hypothetical protein
LFSDCASAAFELDISEFCFDKYSQTLDQISRKEARDLKKPCKIQLADGLCINHHATTMADHTQTNKPKAMLGFGLGRPPPTCHTPAHTISMIVPTALQQPETAFLAQIHLNQALSVRSDASNGQRFHNGQSRHQQHVH